ncbi:PCYCGC domain-containing protein [bacterium]|nr:PCYCGC domain-containing protein [bacterium]
MTSRKDRKTSQRQPKAGKSSNFKIRLSVIGLIALIFGGWYIYPVFNQTAHAEASRKNRVYRGASMMHEVILDPSSYRFRETKPVLDPMGFQNLRQIKAYTLAKQMPRVLDQLFCFCGCAMSIGHKSLLSCFTDDHAANCDICMEEAELAAEMIEKGAPLTSIADAIDRDFS